MFQKIGASGWSLAKVFVIQFMQLIHTCVALSKENITEARNGFHYI
jgi:hypothetical protein